MDYQFASHAPVKTSVIAATEALCAADRARARASTKGNVEPGVGFWDPQGCWKPRPASPRPDRFPGPKPVETVGPALFRTAVLSKTLLAGAYADAWDSRQSIPHFPLS